MSKARFFDILGVSNAVDAAARWPLHAVHKTTGLFDPDPSDAEALVLYLQNALTFANILPGAEPGRVGLTAEVIVGSTPPVPLVLVAMPDIEFQLLPTTGAPARLWVTQSDRGSEIIIEALPVEIRLPMRMIMPLEGTPGGDPPLETTLISNFVSGFNDTLTVILRRNEPSAIRVHVKVRITESLDFVIEPATPISIGPCRFSGLACRGVHDLQLIPSPLLGVYAQFEHFADEQALEWTRHPLLAPDQDHIGLIAARTIDLDESRPPFDALTKRTTETGEPESRIELIVEDVAFPIGTDPFPVPSHFLIGLRRNLGPNDDPEGALNLGGLAIPLGGVSRVLGFNFLVIEQLLFRSVPSAELSPTQPDRQFAFVKVALTKDATGTGHGVTIELTDEWTVIGGWRHDPALPMFKLFGTTFGLLGVRAGVSIQRLSGDKDFLESTLLLADIHIQLSAKPTAGSEGVVALESKTANPKGFVLHGFGYRFKEPALGGFWESTKADFVAFDVIRLQIEEFGLVTESTGAVYFSFSGSLSLPGGSKPAGSDTISANSDRANMGKHDGTGFRFIRLRGKIAGAEEAPRFLIDGIGLSVRYEGLLISGFGMISEYVQGANRHKECGLALEVRFPAGGTELLIGALFFHGHVQGPNVDFRYWMLGFKISPIPIGTVTLTDVRGLFAWNMQPALADPSPGPAPSMRLYEWYKAFGSSLQVPVNRNLSAGGWKPEEESWAFAVGAKVGIGGHRCVAIDAFFFYARIAGGRALLVGAELFLFGNKKPIGFAVFELLGDRWSLLIGLSLGTENVTGKRLPVLDDVPLLAGTLYLTNKPGTLAIGQVTDPATWLSLRAVGQAFDLFRLEFTLGFCWHIVDVPEGPRAFAFRMSLTGGSRLFKVGGIDFYISLGLIAGNWRNESQVQGFIGVLEGGLHIDIFYVFNWGASVKLEWDWLGPDPVFRRLACTVKIHTPWWLPDVTFQWIRCKNTPQLASMAVVSTPLIEASAKALALPEPSPAGAITPVSGAAIDPAAVYSLAQLAAIPPAPADPPETEALATDSVIALHFKPSVDDRIVWGENTPPAVGTEKNKDLSVRYEFVELGIRRRARFGPGAGVWTTLLDPAASRIDGLVGQTGDPLTQRFLAPVRLRWDADFQREGKLDSRRLLINADTPYLTASANFLLDELLLQNMPGWPCCPPGATHEPVWHTIEFSPFPAATRVPSVQVFSQSTSTLHWLEPPPPLVAASEVSLGIQVARVAPESAREGLIARINFSDIAHTFEIDVRWNPQHLNRSLLVSTFRGLKKLSEKELPLSQHGPGAFSFADNDGITHVLLTMTGRARKDLPPDFGFIEVVELRYRSLQETLIAILERERCDRVSQPGGATGGRFAWLPNHDYDVSLRTRATVRHERSGEQVREIPQHLFFRTKGLPGLNAASRVGEELEPYVDSVYPARSRPLYRSEPAAIGFNERYDVFQEPSAGYRPEDPLERRQKFDWILAVQKDEDGQPVSAATSDWIIVHRGAGTPPVRDPVITADVVIRSLPRSAPSRDSLVLRFEAILASPSSCGETVPLRSRVLLHDPFDPQQPDSSPALWPPRTVLRGCVQPKDGPWVNRAPFVSGDETAFSPTGGGPWIFENGVVGPDAAGTGRRLARFGEATWDHLRMRVIVDPNGGIAGAALAGGNALFLIDQPAGLLRIIVRRSGVDQELGSAAIGAAGPYTLEVSAFDDQWQASIGDARVDAPRDELRSGRAALVAEGTAPRFRELRVEPAEAYRFDFRTSRYRDFAEHIRSFSGRIARLPEAGAGTQTIASLLTAEPPAEVMHPAADPLRRQRRFDTWTGALAILLRSEVERVELTFRPSGGGADLLLLESAEPVSLAEDVALRLEQLGGVVAEIPLAMLSDGSQNRTLLLPLDSAGAPTELASGTYRLVFNMNRQRFRTNTADPAAHVQSEGTIEFAIV